MKGIATLVLLLSSVNALACELSGAKAMDAGQGYVLKYRLDPPVIEMGQHFAVAIKICKGEQVAQVKRISVNAQMPAHGHGMNYRPGISSLANGEHTASGLLFHMPGHWELLLDINVGGSKISAIVDYFL